MTKGGQQHSATGARTMTMVMENQVAIRTHKGKGIASFVIGVTDVILFIGLIGAAGVATQTGKLTPGLNVVLGLGMFAACFVGLIGIGLGVFAAVDRSSKKTYPALGLA